ncbi:structural maintenance of chromosomes protein 1B isoform X2 [Scleropages formosus]|uniref:Structural maintenance of chromosomes protein n=1 Tax=Scleropages formosus TaxID=113540 RepID=A0A8C9SG85_SCLFO|nr:structural maintenance of chromosomes protein 1B-like isoform X2 [Scleropages formosus]
MGYLKQIVVENFKSWRGRQVIGPFHRFSCIIGTNGSGKSNLMDAVSFVVGERAASLRVKHVRDLVHGAHVGRPVARAASVAMLYCEDDGAELLFCRSVAGDSSEYSINGKQVTFAKYTAELEKIGVVVKARNCLVFQGAVESIAMKDAKEMSRMFERISGSLELAEEYNQKKEALQKAKEDTQFHYKKKKAAALEKKHMSQVKEETQKYQYLMDDLNQAKLQLTLCQLYHSERGIGVQMESLRRSQVAVAEKSSGVALREQAVKVQKKEHGRLSRSLQQIEKESRAEEQKLAHHQQLYVKAKVNTAHQERKAQAARTDLQGARNLLRRKEQDLEELRRELADLDRAQAEFEREVEEEGVARGTSVQLEQEQLERYAELKEVSRKQSATLRQQLEKLRWDHRADCEKLEFDRRRKTEVEVSIKHTQAQLEEFTRRANKLLEYGNTCNSALEEHRKQEQSLSAELEEGRARSKVAEKELAEVLGELQNARIDSQESRGLERRNEVLENLRRLYPETMYGRLFDLCHPVHKKYQLAVTKVFGHYMNAIVVASERVARDCIRLVKEERAEPETFLPLDYITVSPLNERLRELPGAKMVADVIQCALLIRKAVQFVCGNALVCETLKEAQQIAFGGPERHKTVALDGTMFFKSGVISGGSSHLRSKARCWDEKDVNKLKERKEQLAAELHALLKLRRKEAELKQAQAQAKGIHTRLKYSQSELEAIRTKSIPACLAEKSRLESELVNLESDIKMQKENMEGKEAKMQAIQDNINKMDDEIFSDFCTEIGVANIREYEQEHLKQQQEVDRKRLQFGTQRTRLTTQLEYESTQLEQQMKKIRELEDAVYRAQKSVAQKKKEEERLLKDVDETMAKLEELRVVFLEQKSLVDASKEKLDEKLKRLQESSKELAKLQRDASSLQTALEQKRLERHNLLLGCKVQGLPIVLLSGSLDYISDVQADSEIPSTGTTMDIYEREEQIQIDYSVLRRELKELQSEEEVSAEVEQLQEAVSSLETALQRSSTPNFKALEKMREVKEIFQRAVDAFDTSTRVAKQRHHEFEQVKARRFRLFNQCFEHVAISIDQIYKDLCRNPSAQAIISVENPDEPYLEGITYHCVAPGKRFMAMDNLSGGEKAIAALSLLFAIHSFRPAPFFVLDEVDAALDNTNIGKVTRYIREQSREHFQVIVISLKEEFYSKADALLGVYSEFNDFSFSRLLTVDLTPYPLSEDTNAEREEV